MSNWPARPVIYEINTWVWLGELSRRHAQPITLANVPESVWDTLAGWNIDAVWLMGVWERSPEGRRIALANEQLMAGLRQTLPDLRPDDVLGSPFCVQRYEVDPHLGGREGLARAREALARRGIRLILDFVPNHVAPDHPWTAEHPEYFIQGSEEDLARAPADWLRVGPAIFARGRDPHLAPWPEVLQLNAFNPGLRAAASATLRDIAAQCDGVRCDMAMLLMNDIFAQTWGQRAGPPPAEEYWAEVLDPVRRAVPEFIWIAEVYWNREWALMQLGFTFCYDKVLYDRLARGDAGQVRAHLAAAPSFQARLVRFIENHDEPRAATLFGPARQRVAAVAAMTLPGARLLHEGQFEGRTAQLPVFLARRPIEVHDQELPGFYRRLLAALRSEPLRRCSWHRCVCANQDDPRGSRDLLAWLGTSEATWALVVVNLGGTPAYGRVHMAWDGLSGQRWTLEDALSGATYERDGDEMYLRGLHVILPAWGAHLFLTSVR